MAHLEEVESLPIRRPIALYYSSSEEHLQQDLQGSYLNPSFGPMANSSPADFALLCSRSAASSKRAQRPSIALIVPHGAYCDAGPVTAHAYFELAKSELAFDSVVVIGTNHRGYLSSTRRHVNARYRRGATHCSLSVDLADSHGHWHAHARFNTH